MRGVCSWTDAPALFGVWPCREFVQRCVAQIQGGGGGGRVAVNVGAEETDGRAVRAEAAGMRDVAGVRV